MKYKRTNAVMEYFCSIIAVYAGFALIVFLLEVMAK
jgi:hypothetical protein